MCVYEKRRGGGLLSIVIIIYYKSKIIDIFIYILLLHGTMNSYGSPLHLFFHFFYNLEVHLKNGG